MLSRGHYHWQHQPCWYAVREGGQGHWQGARDQTTIWTVDGKNDDQDTSHSTQKPVECMRRPIQNNSKPGDAVCEPFSGSGTTIIAAEIENRRCFAVELSPEYVDVAVLRWQAFTGSKHNSALAKPSPKSLNSAAYKQVRVTHDQPRASTL